MHEEVEGWIEEMLDQGTFESREDVLEFCVYATKTFAEANDLNIHGEGPMGNPDLETGKEEGYVPIKLDVWKDWLDENKDVVNLFRGDE